MRIVLDTTGISIDEAVAQVLATGAAREQQIQGAARGASSRLMGLSTDPVQRNACNLKVLNSYMAMNHRSSKPQPSRRHRKLRRAVRGSLSRKEMRIGEVITAEVVRVDHNFVVVNAGLKSESYHPDRRIQERPRRGRSQARRLRHRRHRGAGRRLRRDRACRATRPSAWRPGSSSKKRWRQGDDRKGVDHRQGQGRPDRHGQRHPRVPARLAGRHPSGEGHHAVRRQGSSSSRSSSSTASATTWSCRAAPCSRRPQGEEREKLLATLQEGAIVKGIVKNITDYGAFVDLGGIDGLLHITDLAWRRVKHPSEVLTVGDEVTAKVLKFDQEKNRVSLGMKQLGEDPWVGIVAPLPAGHAPVRQGHQPHRLRRVRRDRVGHRGPGARLRDGLDQQERPSVQGRAAGRRGRGHDPRDRRGAPPHLARHEAVHAEPVGRVRA